MEQARDVGFETAILGGRGHAEKLFERIIVAASDLAAKWRVFKVCEVFWGERIMLMLASWARFAHTGAPASDISGAWRPVSPDGKGINILGGENGYQLADAVQPGRTAAWKI